MKLMILDGNSIVNRAFYGLRPLHAPDGTPTHAVYGFVAILQRLLEEQKPEALCVSFDLKAPTFRHERYAAYKAQRKPMPEELVQQMPLLKELLDDMGIRRYELEGYEADDILGAAAAACEREGWDCVIVTGDKDSLQLVTAHTSVCNVKSRMGQTETILYTPERFEEEYGFAPKHMIDLKALMGDASDNIPGVPGVGEKTALELLRRYGSLDAIYRDLDALDVKPGVRAKLAAGEESARLSYWLATIRTELPLHFVPEENRWDRNYTPALYGFLRRLGFQKFIERWGLQPDAEAESAAEEPAFSGTCRSVTPETAAELETALAGRGDCVAYYAWDSSRREALLHYSPSDTEAVAIFLSPESYRDDYAEALGRLFAPEIPKAGHEVKNLIRDLLELGVDATKGWVFDTALAAYLLHATGADYALDSLCRSYAGFALPREETEEESGQITLDLDGASQRRSLGVRLSALASRAAAVEALEDILRPRLRQAGQEELLDQIELPLCAVLAQMEQTGFFVDRQALSQFGESLNAGITQLQESIWQHAGGQFNIQSPKQLGEVLFDRLLLPSGKKTKTGWSTNAEVLEKLRGKHPIVEEVLDYRMLTKLKSTYADGLLKVISPDGRIHTSFQMTVTATGRLSSTEPNLQNIPVRKKLGAQIRTMFVAAPGMVLVDADYSQIELRLLAHISGDEAMREAFLSGEDFHTVTASKVFNVPLAEVDASLRSRAKAVNFGIVYGISAFSLAQDIGVFPNEAKRYMEAYLEKYHGVRDYMKRIVEQAKQQGYVSTLYGRRRELPELKSSNFNMRAFGERVALNMPIQGTAADIIKLAMVQVHRRLEQEGLRARLILQVHDELIVECPEEEGERVCELLRYEMEHAAELSVPLTVDVHMGRSWAEAH